MGEVEAEARTEIAQPASTVAEEVLTIRKGRLTIDHNGKNTLVFLQKGTKRLLITHNSNPVVECKVTKMSNNSAYKRCLTRTI